MAAATPVDGVPVDAGSTAGVSAAAMAAQTGATIAAERTVSTPRNRYNLNLIAALVAMAILLLALLAAVFIWHIPQSWWGSGQPPVLAERDRQAVENGLLEALRAERDRLKGLLDGDVCALPSSELPGGALDLPPRGTPVQPDAPDAATPQTPDGAAAPAPSPAHKASTLNDYLERSTVLILTDSAMGSGFFVDSRHIVTNRHVVESENGGGAVADVLVTSKALGGLLEGHVQTTTAKSEIGTSDYAIIELDETPADHPVALPLARHVEKLETVIAAGFPGYLVMQDPAMQRLRKGDVSAAPEMVLSEGKVQVVHYREGAPPIIIHSADISQGNSGGPLVDECGRLVGINTFIGMDEESGRRGLFSLGAADLSQFLARNGIAVRVEDTACTPAAPTPERQPGTTE